MKNLAIRTIIVFVFFLGATSFAVSTGKKSPASSAQESSPTTSWTNIDSVFASDDERASYTGTTEDSIYVTNFSMGVPAGATIDSIHVETEAQGDASQSSRRRLHSMITKNGVDHASTNEPSHTHAQDTDDLREVTGSSNPLWGTTWTVAEVNATTFGVILFKSASQAGTILLDHVQIRIAYTEAGGDELRQRRRRIMTK